MIRKLLVMMVMLQGAWAAGAQALGPWGSFWMRQPGMGSAALDEQMRHEGRPAMRIEHLGEKDWSLEWGKTIPVKAGDVIEWSGWVRIDGGGELVVSGIVRGEQEVMDWSFGQKVIRGTKDWTLIKARMVMPGGTSSFTPRVIGNGAVKAWVEGFAVAREGNVDAMRDPKLPEQIVLSNDEIELTFDNASGSMRVTDLRNGLRWRQAPSPQMLVKSARKNGNALELTFLDMPTITQLSGRIVLDGHEVEVSISGEGPISGSIQWPSPITTGAGTYLVVPMNEGIAYRVDDQTIRPMRLIAYGEHGICMAFFGATDGKAGYQAILETPDDASISIQREGKYLCIAPQWDPQKGQVGYERKIRYIFFEQGGHVAMCKRYRAYAQSIGLLKTFEAKRRERPNIDRLIGAVNVWCWDRDPVGIVRELHAAGIDRILWSNQASPQAIDVLNQMGVLTGRYDIYQDVMDPSKFREIGYVHPDWTTPAWPKDLMIGPDGDWIRGWEVKARNGQMIPCGVTCDKEAIKYADLRIPGDMGSHHYGARFIDTTTASPWRECYSKEHPLTRSESRKYKMELLGLVSGKYKLICGSETGHDAAVPYADYFEGMLSLGPYRVPDAGRDIGRIWTSVPENISRFQVGYAYRLPLWELVFHDCVEAQWYWGDYSNKLPAVWDRRDQFNALYGTVPMFMFTRDYWEKNKERFLKSYQATCPLAREVGYAQMIDHRFLKEDWSIQQTVFSNGVKVTVDFNSGKIEVERPSAAR